MRWPSARSVASASASARSKNRQMHDPCICMVVVETEVWRQQQHQRKQETQQQRKQPPLLSLLTSLPLFLRSNLLLGRPRWVVLGVPLDVSLLFPSPTFLRTCTPLPAASCYSSAPLPARGSTCRSGLSIPHHIVRTPPIGRGSRTAVRGIQHTPAVLSRGPRDAASEPRCTTHWRAKGRRGGPLSSQGASAYGRP